MGHSDPSGPNPWGAGHKAVNSPSGAPLAPPIVCFEKGGRGSRPHLLRWMKSSFQEMCKNQETHPLKLC